jgi:hypothetical protein
MLTDTTRDTKMVAEMDMTAEVLKSHNFKHSPFVGLCEAQES